MRGQLLLNHAVQFCVLTLILFLMPLAAHAQAENVDAVANLQCKQEVAKRAAMKPPMPPPPNPPHPCEGPHTKGTCMGPICKGETFKAGAGQSGGTAGLEQLGRALGDLMKQLMQGGGGGGGGGGGSPSPLTGTPSLTNNSGTLGGCTQYFQTSDVSQLSNPCAQYVPSISDQITTTDSSECDPLSASLGICSTDTATNGTNTNTNTNGNTNITANASTNSAASTNTPPRVIFQLTSIGGIGIPGGVRGDILQQGGGVTLIAGSRDEKSNVEVAGFYGSDTFGSKPQGLIAGWCRTRPWASNFLSKIIAPSFFDGLCATRGYQVGEPPPPAQGPVIRGHKTQAATSTPAATTTLIVEPRVDIWATPASVPLGGRTLIFWNTQDVVNCVVSSTDGSFNEKSLSGGAATVPITVATTFTIECDVSDGTKVSGSVTVHLKI